MPLREIIHYPSEVLRQAAQPVVFPDPGLAAFVQDMFETMKAAPGVGLAAPQVNVGRQVLVMDPQAGVTGELALVNPEIIFADGEIAFEEGCLSIPGYFAEVQRAARIRVRAQDVEGRSLDIELEGFDAVVAQHEIDHLRGILFVDYLSRTRWRLFEKDFGRDPFRWKYAAGR